MNKEKLLCSSIAVQKYSVPKTTKIKANVQSSSFSYIFGNAHSPANPTPCLVMCYIISSTM